MSSIWMAASKDAARFQPLKGRIEADAVVIGGGITGVTTAMLLSDSGFKVALLEADLIAGRNTGNSTGNVYGTLSDGLAPLKKKWDADAMRLVVALRLQGLTLIEQT